MSNIEQFPLHSLGPRSIESNTTLMHNGGGGNGGMEARVAKLEALAESTDKRLGLIEQDLREFRREVNAEFGSARSEAKEDNKSLRDDTRTDFRLLLGAMIAGFMGLAGIMAKGFGWL